MQRSFLISSMLFLGVLFLVGCKKEVRETNSNSSIHNDLKLENGNKIRLTSAMSQYGNQTFSYNSEGLVNEWYYSGFEFTNKIEYDRDRRLSKSVFYIGQTLAYTIYFAYEKSQVIKETWYDGSSNQVFDEVFHTVDPNGTLVRMESFIQHYYAVYQYTNDHQLSRLIFYVGGLPVVKFDYTYQANYKNPFNAIPGLTYAFLFGDGILWDNKIVLTSLSATYYDQSGNEIFRDFQDPALTTIEAGPEHYPASVLYYNIAFDSYSTSSFTYENCSACPAGKIGRNSVATNSLRAGLNKFLVHDPKHQMKDKAAELRMEVRKFKNGS